MATFQFKNSKYKVTPPQDGAPSIVNEGTADSTYKQDISNLPISSITSRSVNLIALSQICLSQAVGTWTDNEELRALLQQEYGGCALLDLTKDGKITSQDSLIFLRLSAETEPGYSLSIYQRAYKIIEVLEENYEKYKNYTVNFGGTTTPLYNGPPSSDQGFFDPKQHYIVVDADDPIDRLKLLKYKKGSNLNSSYWYDAGTGNEAVNTQGLVSIDGRASKGSKTSKITANTVTFDGSSASIVNTTTNTITIPNHKFQTGDAVVYTVGTGIEFLAGDSSVVDVANNKIIYQNHGYETGDYITYSVARGGTAIAPLTDGSLLEIEKVDNNSFKLRDRSITTAITFTGLGLGTSKISGSRIPDSDSGVKYQGRLFVISASDGNSLRFADTYDDAIAGNEISFAGLGVGQTHKLSANYISDVGPGDFVGVYEIEVFTNVQVATNTNEITITNHGFNTGDTAVYRLGSGATAAAGIEVGTKYFIRSIDSDTIKIALSSEDAHQSSDSFHVNITSAGNGAQFFEIEYGTKVYKISDDNTLLVNTSDDIVFTNRPIKKSNFTLDTGKDVIVSKVFKYRSVGRVNGATTSSTTFNFDALYGEKPQIGAILTGQNVSGTPKITSITYGTPGAGGLTGTATVTTSQSLSDDQEIVFESFAQEPYVALDSGDSLQDDLDPQLSTDLELNGQTIKQGTTTALDVTSGNITVGNSIQTNTISIGSAATIPTPSTNTQTVKIGCDAGAAGVKVVKIANSTGQVSSNTTIIGSNAPTVGTSSTTIYGNTVIEHGNNSFNPITIGGTYQTGTITFGRAQTSQTINIGSTYSSLSRTQTINIGSHSSPTTTTQNITIGGTASTQTISINPNTKTSNVLISTGVPSTGSNILTIIGHTASQVGTGTCETRIKSTTKPLIVESNATSLSSQYSGITIKNTPAGSGSNTVLSMHQYLGTNRITSYWGPGSIAALIFDFSSSGEKGRFHTNGNFGLGVTNPSAKLHVVGDIIATGNITAYYSDERLKDLKGAIPNALEKVNKLTGYYYKPNALAHSLGVDNTDLEVGVSAQEVEEVLPEIVTKSAVGTDAFGEDYKSVHYDKLTPLLIEAVKELTKKVEILEKRLNEGE